MTLKYAEFTVDSLKQKNIYKFEKVNASRGNPAPEAMVKLIHFLYDIQRKSITT